MRTILLRSIGEQEMGPRDELVHNLSSPVEDERGVLVFFKLFGKSYPVISKMARDFLATNASFCSIREKVF